MSKIQLTDKDGEVRELTAEDLKDARPAADVVPDIVKTYQRSRGRPQKAHPKISTTLRLSPEVMKYFRATGKGWQTRIDQVLRRYVETSK